jgi:hypothetical protein
MSLIFSKVKNSYFIFFDYLPLINEIASKRDLALKLRQHEPEWNMQYHHKWGRFQPEETCNFNINEFRTSGKLKMVGNE